MSDTARRLLTGVVILALLGAGAYAGWRWGGDALFGGAGWMGARPEAEVSATPELAEAARSAIEAFQGDSDASRMTLGAPELASLLRYSAPDVLPEGVTPPGVAFESDRVRLWSRVALNAFPRVPEVERIVGVLPDTVPVEVTGSILPYEAGGAALRVDRIRLAGIPLPGRLTPRLLEVLGREDRPGLPPDAMDVPLPAGVASAYIFSDSLVLVAARRE